MRRLLLAALLLLPVTTTAGIIATARNGAGGQIMLTDVHGECNADWIAFSRADSGEYIAGCWSPLDKGIVIVRWNNGEVRMYDTADFEYIGEEALDGI